MLDLSVEQGALPPPGLRLHAQAVVADGVAVLSSDVESLVRVAEPAGS